MMKPWKKIRTLKQKIFVAFFIYSSVSFLVSVITFSLFRQLEDLDRVSQKISEFYHLTLRGIKVGQDFFVYETTDPEFYELGRSGILNEHHLLIQEIQEKNLELQRTKKAARLIGEYKLHYLDSLLNSYIKTYRKIVVKLKYKGFRDYGLTGRMRFFAHKLEASEYIDQKLLLEIRRNEKDYILRNDTSYMYNVIELSNQMRQEIMTNNRIAKNEKEELRNWLSRYNSVFLKVVEVDLEVGHKNRTGLSMMLKEQTERLDEFVNSFYTTSQQRYQSIFDRFQVTVVVIVTISVILTVLLSMSFRYVLNDNEEDALQQQQFHET